MTEMAFLVSEAYDLPVNVHYFVGSVMASYCESMYPVHTEMVEATSQRILIDETFSTPVCERLARMSYDSYRLMRILQGAMPWELRRKKSEKKRRLLGLQIEEHQRIHQRNNVFLIKWPKMLPRWITNDRLWAFTRTFCRKIARSITLTHGDNNSRHFAAQIFWYPEKGILGHIRMSRKPNQFDSRIKSKRSPYSKWVLFAFGASVDRGKRPEILKR